MNHKNRLVPAFSLSLLHSSTYGTVSDPARLAADRARALSTAEREVIEFFIHLAVSLGLPRSLGELYGLLYCAEEPLPFEEIVAILGISKGSASQGLRTLQGLNAVRTVYLPRDRRTFYRAEISLRQLLNGFLETKLHPFLHGAGMDVERLAETVSSDPASPSLANRQTLRQRVQGLRTWHRRTTQLLPLLARLTGAPKPHDHGPETP